MRMIFSFCFAFAAAPALAQGVLQITPTTPEATADAQSLANALVAALSPGAERADCPLTVAESGDIPIAVSFVAGPPTGWSLVLGPADTPLFSTMGPTGDAAAAANGILDTLCPKQGSAATEGPWQASGGAGGLTVSGTVQSLLAPFTLEGKIIGGSAVFEYVPVNIGGGAVAYTMSGSGVTGSGEGLYALQAMPDGVFILEQTTDGCVDGIPGSCRQNSDTITLTPVEK